MRGSILLGSAFVFHSLTNALQGHVPGGVPERIGTPLLPVLLAPPPAGVERHNYLVLPGGLEPPHSRLQGRALPVGATCSEYHLYVVKRFYNL